MIRLLVIGLVLVVATPARAGEAYVDDRTGAVCLDPPTAEAAVKALETRPDLEAALDTWEAVDRIRREQVRTATVALSESMATTRAVVEAQRKGPPAWMLVGLGVLVGGGLVAAGAWGTK